MNTELAFKRLFIYHLKYRALKCFAEDAVLMYSGIEFQIEVPEKSE